MTVPKLWMPPMVAILCFGVVVAAAAAPAPKSILNMDGKVRLIILSDIGNEVDDQQSFVRVLMYGDVFDFEGFIATTSCHMKTKVKPQLFTERITAYGQARDNLIIHSPSFPTESSLHSLVKSGQTGFGMAAVGDDLNTAGSDHIVSVVDKKDPRPVYIVVWGGSNTLAQALWRVKKERSADDVKKFVARIRVFEDAGQDDAGAWATHAFPGLFWVRNQKNDDAFAPGHRPAAGGDQTVFSDQWVRMNIQNAHGALGALYLDGGYVKENDSPTFTGLIPNGLNGDCYDLISFGGWGGRHLPDMVKNVVSGSSGNPGNEHEWGDWYMFTDAPDTWTYNGTTYTNSVYAALFRWRQAYQNDFAARMDWCVKPYKGANHPPVVAFDGKAGTAPVELNVKPGQTVSLSAAGSSDPDGNTLSYKWYVYPEAGTYGKDVPITDSAVQKTSITVPGDADGRTIHVILEVTDSGTPPLKRYRRVILTVKGTDRTEQDL